MTGISTNFPAFTFSISGVVWVQGLVGQSCTSTCSKISASCSNTGPWPVQYSDFTTLLSASYDLTTCTSPLDYKTCQYSSCNYIIRDDAPYPSDPEGETESYCYYGGVHNTCDAIPDYGRRFCPCVKSSIGLVTASPASVPSPYPSYVYPGPPSLNPANAFSTAGIVWVQGLVGQSCTSTCLSLSASCSSSGPWPVQYSDFTTLLSVSYDLTACTSPPTTRRVNPPAAATFTRTIPLIPLIR